MKSRFHLVQSRYGKSICHERHTLATVDQVFALLQWQEKEIERLRGLAGERQAEDSPAADR